MVFRRIVRNTIVYNRLVHRVVPWANVWKIYFAMVYHPLVRKGKSKIVAVFVSTTGFNRMRYKLKPVNSPCDDGMSLTTNDKCSDTGNAVNGDCGFFYWPTLLQVDVKEALK